MAVFNKDIFALSKADTYFRQEILTNKHSQLVLMSVEPGDDISEEVHTGDQILVFTVGSGESVLNRERSAEEANSLVAVPAGTRPSFIYRGFEVLKLLTMYAPPEEAPGTLHRTKADAPTAAAE